MENNGNLEKTRCMICKITKKKKVIAISFGYSAWAEMHLFVCHKHLHLLDVVHYGEGSGT